MLKLNIQGNVDFTLAIQDAIYDGAKCLEKFRTSTVMDIEVHVKKEHKSQYSVTLTSGSKSVTADAADLYKAIGDSFEKMETVFSKDKSIKLHRRNHPEHPVLDDLTENEE
ncbi:HPF/RaiA family ribosome-associated protein [Escherichia coli]|nr:HPF/RaiA family ribosome-associated protein [Escherichia coli]MED6573308.1 HPF/RaiA family ribosome-associated protein [Escherichia coli O157]QDF13917.1 ribosome-associated inhibitor A [Escherichia phage vB_EcoM_phAPEC6]